MNHINYNLVNIQDTFFLEYEEDAGFLDWCALEGSDKINELSRQLRSYLNYKCSIIRFRYSESRRDLNTPKKSPVLKWEAEVSSLFSRLITLLTSIGVKEDTITLKIQSLMKKVSTLPNDIEINLLKDIKHLSSDIWKRLHILSELEIHHHPKLLNVLIQVSGVLCSTQGVYFLPYFKFYQELKRNYKQLEGELSHLLQFNINNQSNEEKDKIKVRITR